MAAPGPFPLVAASASAGVVPLRQAARERVPFGWRIAARRAPAVLGWLRKGGRPRGAPFRHLVAERATPLRRARVHYDEALQAGKETNVRRVAERLDGLVLGPHEVFSWNDEVGPPLRARGFVDGPEVHDGVLTAGVGGGACQVANLVYWLAVYGGLEIRERHRHALDLFPDDHRDVPFGLGATVFWPTRDLVVANPHPRAVHFALAVRDGRLWGRLTSALPAPERYEVVERDHAFRATPDGVWRENRLFRVRVAPDGARAEALLAEHRARVAYPVPQELLS